MAEERWTTAICDNCGQICGRDNRGRVTFSCSCGRVPATASEIEVVPASSLQAAQQCAEEAERERDGWKKGHQVITLQAADEFARAEAAERRVVELEEALRKIAGSTYTVGADSSPAAIRRTAHAALQDNE
jgi:hypothetical protein